MGLLGKLFGRSGETDDQKEIRLYNEEKSAPHRVTESAPQKNPSVCLSSAKACFVVDDVFTISGRGTVVTGSVEKGSFSVGDHVTIDSTQSFDTVITGIEQFRKTLDTVNEGDNAGMLLKDVSRGQLSKGDLIIK